MMIRIRYIWTIICIRQYGDLLPAIDYITFIAQILDVSRKHKIYLHLIHQVNFNPEGESSHARHILNESIISKELVINENANNINGVQKQTQNKYKKIFNDNTSVSFQITLEAFLIYGSLYSATLILHVTFSWFGN